MKNKKSLTLSLICLAIIACFSTFFGTSVIFAADEYTYSCNINGITANFTYNLNEENKIENLKCTNSIELTGNVTIPGLIEGKEVVTIGDNAFKGASNITGVVVPDSVKEIKNNSFTDCTKLKDVNLGKIESLSFDVFKNCTALTSIKIPNTLKQGAVSKIFTNCSNLTNITLEDGLTVIPSYLCADTAITEITIPDSVKTIEYSAFEDCTNLKKITILDNVDSIGFFGINKPTDSVFKNHDEDLTIYCYRDSIAAKYAIKYNIKYVYLDKPIIDDSKAEDNKDVNNNEQIIEDSNDNNEQVLDNSNINEQSNNPKTGDVTFYILGILILAVAGCTIVPMCLRKEIK